MRKHIKYFNLLIASTFSLITAHAADLTTGNIEVLSITPLDGIGLTPDRIPSSLQNIKSKDLKSQQSTTIADFMSDNLLGISVTDTQNNPYQPDVTYRGYSVSPLQGGQTGMSVYVDGVRVNDAFGDGVSWDLIPTNSINGVSLMPGSNPIFGLNTLGGSLSIQTKGGRTNPGVKAEVSAGSWGRKIESAEFGGVSNDGAIDYFISANVFNEEGWRNASNSAVRQIFGKLGWENKTTKINLSYTGANNDLTGNGLMPADMMATLGREAIFTKPDITSNNYGFLNLSGSHWLTEKTMLSGNLYYKLNERTSLNGDANDGFDTATFFDTNVLNHAYDHAFGSNATGYASAAAKLVDAAKVTFKTDDGTAATNLLNCAAASKDADEHCNGVTTRTNSRQHSAGFSGQLSMDNTVFSKPNQFILGGGYEKANVEFNKDVWYGLLTADRGVTNLWKMTGSDKVQMHSENNTYSVYTSDNIQLNSQWNFTMAGRYNYTSLDLLDFKNSSTSAYNVTGDHTYARFNPSIGLNFNPIESLALFGSYNEGTRIPTALELGCANKNAACKYPNQMAADPHLKQIVARTYEIGGQAKILNDLKLNVSAYRSENSNDIQFVYSSTSLGYFDNIGKTRRIGLDTNLLGAYKNLNWMVGYSYVDATYQSPMDLPNSVNSSAVAGVIHVAKGDQLPNIPEHQLKVRLDYNILPNWNVGTNINVFSDRFMVGNENNKHVDTGDGSGNGKTPGYTIVNLDTNYNIAHGWSLFGKVINVFDKEYSNGGRLGQSILDSSGATLDEERKVAYLAPGAPRAGWIGIRYEFGGSSKKD